MPKDNSCRKCAQQPDGATQEEKQNVNHNRRDKIVVCTTANGFFLNGRINVEEMLLQAKRW